MFKWTVEARQIVKAALETGEAIEVYRSDGRTAIVVDGEPLIPRGAGLHVEALWSSALNRLKRAGYLEPDDRAGDGTEGYWPSVGATLDFHLTANETVAAEVSETSGGNESRGPLFTIAIAVASAVIGAGLQGGIADGAIQWPWALGLGAAAMLMIWLRSTRTFWARLRQAVVVGASAAATVVANMFAGWALLTIWGAASMDLVGILTVTTALVTVASTAAVAVAWMPRLRRLAENAPVWRREFYTRRIEGRPAYWHPIRWFKGHREVQISGGSRHGIQGGGEPTITPTGRHPGRA